MSDAAVRRHLAGGETTRGSQGDRAPGNGTLPEAQKGCLVTVTGLTRPAART